jgi:hypothetical protein
MDKIEHGLRLKQAMARTGRDRTVVADSIGVGTRTVTNWTSGATMPSDRERAALRKLFGDYDNPGDPVEIAIRSSELAEWRQDTVIGFYKKHLAEQREASTA